MLFCDHVCREFELVMCWAGSPEPAKPSPFEPGPDARLQRARARL